MAIAYKSQGAGASTETSGAALSPACPAAVDAGDILIAHVFWEGTTTAPSTPTGWDLLSGPNVIETSVARHWVYGRIADGSEDGASVAFGSPAVTTQRGARIYSFSGYVSGTILQLARGFTHQSHATDPQAPTCTTLLAGGLAVALSGQNDDNAIGSFTGESGGDWTEAVAEYTAALTPGLALQIQTCTPTSNPGTVSGGTFNTTNDPVGVIGFVIHDVPWGQMAPTVTATSSVAPADNLLYRRVVVASDGNPGGTSSTSVSSGAVRALAAQVDGVSTTAAEPTVVAPTGSAATVSAQSAVALDMYRLAHRDTQVDALSSTAVSISLRSNAAIAVDALSATAVSMGAKRALAATVGASTSSSVADDQIYRRVVVASSGNPYGVSQITVSVTTVSGGAGTQTATVSAQSATEATLYRVTAVDMGTVAATSTTAAEIQRTKSVAATVDCTSASTVSMSVRTHLAANVDAVSTVASSLSGAQITQHAPTVTCTSTTSVDMLVVRAIAADVAAQSAASADLDLLAVRDIQADATCTTEVAMSVVRAFITQVDAFGVAAATPTFVTQTVPVEGKYRNEHARAYKLVKAVEDGTFSPEHARALKLVTKAGG